MSLSLAMFRDSTAVPPGGAAGPGNTDGGTPSPPPTTGNRRSRRKLRHDLRVLAKFVTYYCQHQHQAAARSPVHLKPDEIDAMLGGPVDLCPDCHKLLLHACVKRSHCPMDPKPACKHCPSHCYHPTYQQKMRAVMKFSGQRMVLSGRIDYLLHLLF